MVMSRVWEKVGWGRWLWDDGSGTRGGIVVGDERGQAQAPHGGFSGSTSRCYDYAALLCLKDTTKWVAP